MLTLSGATAGQFRILGTWPDGNAKWVEVCGILPALAAGGTATVTLTDGGSGNFGGSNMAIDVGTGITVSTGVATFSIQKANFNGFNGVLIGSTLVNLPGTSDGFVITGPAYPSTSCGTASPCTTQYASKNDPGSNVIIEKNGPVEVVLKATWAYTDTNGNVYMRGTARMYFHQGKTSVKIDSVLRNADYGVSNSFATAYKGFQANEFRTGLNLSGTLNYSIANAAGSTSGTMTGTDSVYIYQGQSSLMGDTTWSGCGNPCNNFTADAGYRIAKNGLTLNSGSLTQYPTGWADISNNAGVGLELGAYQFAATGPKSLEFNSGGAVATIGLFARENSFPVFQAWPQWKIDEVYLNFHATEPASLPNEFLKQQHYLVGTAPRTQYNNAGVFMYPLEDPAEEDGYYTAVVNSASPTVTQAKGCCIQDIGTADSNWPMYFYYVYFWNQGGGRNQVEWRYSDLTNFITRHMPGRYVQATQFYRMQAETMLPHADGFTWRSLPHSNSSSPQLDAFGRPTAASAPLTGTVNVAADGVTVTLASGALFMPWETALYLSIGGSNHLVASVTDPMHLVLSSSVGGAQTGVSYQTSTVLGGSNLRSWSEGNGPDQEHMHWWGILDYYFMSGDENIHDAVLNSMSDYYLNPDTYQSGELGGTLSGNVTTSGTNVSLANGSQFASYMAGNPIYINGAVYTVATVTSPTALVLTSSAGNQGTVTYYVLGGVWNARSIGVELSGASRFSTFLASTGDPADAAIVLQQAANDYYVQVKPPLCVSGYPAGCSFGNVNGGPWNAQGISTTRGIENTHDDAGIDHCSSGDYRAEGIFQSSILQQGLWELRTTEGPGWPDYLTALDLAFGQSQWVLTEGSNYDGTSVWTNNGFRYYVALDINNGGCDTNYWPVRPNATVWFPFFIQHQVVGETSLAWKSVASWEPIFDQVMQRTMSSNGIGVGTNSTVPDFGGYQIAAVIDAVRRPGTVTLTNLPVTAFTDNGGGSYTISWVVPTGAQSYRIKWGTLAIVDWIGFDPVNNVFTGDPVHNMNWFAANNVPGLPAPGAAGTTQTLTISTGTTGLTATNFSVKAYAAAGSTSTGTPSNLLMVSGNNQVANVGTALPMPFTAEVTDGGLNPVPGVTVSFSVAAGGGTLSTTSAATNSLGQASTTLTLGSSPGANTVRASSGALTGSPITFTATGTIPSSSAANLVSVSGNSQTGNAGQPLANPFLVKVTDANGNPVSGVAVAFTVTFGGGSLSAYSAATNAQGQASTILTLGPSAGPNTVTAASGSLAGSPITFTATGFVATPGAATVTWSKAPVSSPDWPTANGFMSMNWDPVSRKTVIFGQRGFAGTVNVTNGSNIVTWVSGDKFGDYWQGSISLGGITYSTTGPTTNPVAPPATNNKTQVTLSTSYTGRTGTTTYVAQESLIYSNDVMFYDAGANAWSWGPGTGAQADLCIVDTPTMPGQRHPIGQMTVDTRRGFLWLTGGVNQSCTISPVTTNGSTTVTNTTAGFVMGTNWNGVTVCIGTTASNCVDYTVDHVVSPSTVVMTAPVPAGQTFFRLLPPENKNSMSPNSKYDTYYLTLNADPTTDAWAQVPTALHVPDALVESAMRYDPDDDVIVLFGYDQAADSHDTWVYCSTIGNPGGTLTALQTAAGCTRPDDWTEVATTCVGAQCIRNHPAGSTYTAMVWDSATHNLLQFGGTQGYIGTPQNAVFAYNVPSHQWTQKVGSNGPPTAIWNNSCCLQSTPTIAYDSATQKLLYHYLNNGSSADYVYDPVADSWTMLGSPSAGVGATATNGASGQMATYDAANNMMIGWNEGGTPDIWRGALGTGGVALNTCDLNADGAVNVTDVQIAINQALGTATCTNADLNHDGVCNIIDVQIVINASLGGACTATSH